MTDHDATAAELDRRLDAVRTPAEVDASLDRGDRLAGTAVIRMVLRCPDLALVAPRVERALHAPDLYTRQLGCVAAGDMTRVFGRLSPGIYARLRELGPHHEAQDAVLDVLTFVPWAELPPWFRWRRCVSGVQGLGQRLYYGCADPLGSLLQRVRRRR
ncbi:hypothetical protein Kpho02_08460 [Kitasatospora phosalacinea]|uniref:Uncharacterized protein n=1 Tax=Kitasatospora phosalacinea TaxID=2065 RepID=A0A9W6Q5H8_9ACTN|nr:hypothetical protein [Kitasatospora phosalacinea]GLW68547.1 hypothetical protein Kpho02_08460 [Kitasatospora phosalacinea]